MNDYILLMHGDATDKTSDAQWTDYFKMLAETGRFNGGSAIGKGVSLRKLGVSTDITDAIVGYIRVSAAGLEDAQKLVQGNPVFEAGGTVEIRELPRSA